MILNVVFSGDLLIDIYLKKLRQSSQKNGLSLKKFNVFSTLLLNYI